MFIDASALTAVLTEQDGSLMLLERLQSTSVRLTSPLAVWETTVSVARVLGLPIADAATAVESYLDLAEVVVSPVAPGTAAIALDARYGKGRHPARLNFGDGTSGSPCCSRGTILRRPTSRRPDQEK